MPIARSRGGPAGCGVTPAAMRAFMQLGVHRRVMARLPEWRDEAALVHWFRVPKEPSWAEANRRLQEEGREFEGQSAIGGAAPV